MVNKQVIASPHFVNRGKMSPTLMRSLMIRGSGIQVDDSLRRFGWNGSSAVLTTVMTVNVEAGTIAGVRFESRGQGPEVNFKAKDLWSQADADVTVNLKIDLNNVKWRSEGRTRNQSTWMDSSEFAVTITRNNGESLDTGESLDGAKIGGFVVRLTVLPIQVDKVVLYGGILPMSLAELEEKVGEAGQAMESPLIPTVALKLWLPRGKPPQNGFPMAFMPSESKDDKCGFGVLPLLEMIGSTNPEMPESDELEQQLCLLLSNLAPTNNMALHRLESLLQPDSFPASASGVISYSWPVYTVQGSSDYNNE